MLLFYTALIDDEGERLQFEQIYYGYRKQMLYVAQGILHDPMEAEDAVQNLYLKLWERRDALGGIESDEAYCRRLLKNICIDRWREMRRHEQQSIDEETVGLCDETYSEDEMNDKQSFLRAFLARLHERQRRIFVLRMQGSTYDEMELLTGQSATSLRMTISRLKRELIDSYKRKKGCE